MTHTITNNKIYSMTYNKFHISDSHCFYLNVFIEFCQTLTSMVATDKRM